MSDKSGVSSQVISLPKGGGALHGLGEKFSPDLHSGTGNFSVPLALPAGRNGFQPQLSLSYSTGAGNGLFGLGWSLAVPGVSRRTARGVPRYDDETDVFILSGAEDLVPVAGSYPGRVRYRPRTEGLFALIERQLDAANDIWEVRGKDGLVSVYGTPGARGHDTAVLARTDDLARVFAWRLSHTRDPFGNRIVYEYRQDDGEGDGHRWRQPILKRMRYADYRDHGLERFLISVTFEYDDEVDPPRPRPDPGSEYRAGFEIRTSRRCTAIVTATHAGAERLVRGYRLVYLDERTDLPDLAARLPRNGVSLLSQIQVVGYDDAGQPHADMPPLELDYSRFEPERQRDLFPVTGLELPPRALADPECELADLTGNGLPDIVEIGGTIRYWPNLGEGRFDLPRLLPDAPAGLSLGAPGVRMIDADGDGRIDLLVHLPGLSGYFSLEHEGAWDRRPFRRYEKAPSFDLEDPEVKLVDLDGDGVTDAIRSGTRFECFFNDPHTGWHEVRTFERGPIEAFPDVAFSDPRVKLADMTGDGLHDIVLVDDGTVAYWPNLGYGAWDRRLVMNDGPRFPDGHDPRRILLGDVDGDGLADLVYVDDARITLWVNRGGNGWSAPVVIDGTPPVTDAGAVRLVDLRGSGVSGVLWSADQDGSGQARMFFLDFTGGGKPYLLQRMDNQLGAITEVGYASSTEAWLADAQHPDTRWQTTLPFPVQVVARVRTIDVFSQTQLITEYRYHHGYWDGGEREFRGFGCVEQLDAETGLTAGGDGRPLTPPLCLKTWFHLGPVGPEEGSWVEPDYAREYWSGDPPLFPRHRALEALLGDAKLPRRAKRDALRALRGQVLRTELYALDGSPRQPRPYTVTETWPNVREEPTLATEPERMRVFFPHVCGQRTTEWECGDDPLTRFAFTNDYDAFGQPQRASDVACPRGWRALDQRPGQPFLATRQRTVFAQPAWGGPYLHDRVAGVTRREMVNDGHLTIADLLALPDAALPVIGQTLSYYDRDSSASATGAFAGLSWGQLGDYGAPVRSERLVLTESMVDPAYGSERPPYLMPSGAAVWTADYPLAFQALCPVRAGYVHYAGAAGDPHVAGYFVSDDRRRYDFHDDPGGTGRGLVTAIRDALGHESTVAYDAPYQLLPVQVIDAAGMATTAVHDYRVLQPARVIDANGTTTACTYSPLGLLESLRVQSASGTEGDLTRPSVQFRHDFLAYAGSPANGRQPVWVETRRALHHETARDVPLPQREEIVVSRVYSDGFGRVLQTRSQSAPVRYEHLLLADQADPASGEVRGQVNTDSARPNVVVTGWQTYDNKGRVVEKYEPFFSVGWDYVPPAGILGGPKVTFVHDPRGRPIRTVHPDGAEQRVVFGVPSALDDPERFVPTPWETYTYDANDNAGRTHRSESAPYQPHWNTPTSDLVDALGRTVAQIQRNGADPGDWYTTTTTYDIRGNLLTLTDALGRRAFSCLYNLAGQRLRLHGIDAGSRLSVHDAAGNLIEVRDGAGGLRLSACDALLRLTHVWARDRAGEAVTLRERLVYGDDPQGGLSPGEVQDANLRGRLHHHYDEAGRLSVPRYDFKGNALEKLRQVIDAGQILAVFGAPGARVSTFRVDWDSAAGAGPGALAARAAALLDPTRYAIGLTYDALNRVKAMQYPQGADGRRPVLRPTYDLAGGLERLVLEADVVVDHIAYDARGQRTLIVYGNGVMTRSVYDPLTFRLRRVRNEGCTRPAALSFRPAGPLLQDVGHDYDLSGNVTAIHDRTPASGLAATPDRLDRVLAYDPLYRLRSASGRESDLALPPAPWDDSVRGDDVTRTRAYVQDYYYDPAGNVESVRHRAVGGDVRRDFTLVPGTNRLASLAVAGTTYTYGHDACGNVTGENGERHFEWDHAARLRAFRVQSGTSAEPSQYVHYLYDGGGQRVMKLARTQGGAAELTLYVDGIFEHHRWSEGGQARPEHPRSRHG